MEEKKGEKLTPFFPPSSLLKTATWRTTTVHNDLGWDLGPAFALATTATVLNLIAGILSVLNKEK